MQNIKFKIGITLALFVLFFAFGSADAQLVTCGQTIMNPCGLSDLGILARNVFNFIIAMSILLAGLVIVAGAAVLIISGGSPGLVTTARRMIWGAILALFIIFGAWLIVFTILTALGYRFF